jgi:hypothetical protein
MMCKFILTGAILALLAGTAAAQDTQDRTGLPLNYKPPPTQEEIERQKALDRAYQATVQKIPDKKSSADPWGAIRPAAPASSSAAKTKQQ